MQTDSNITYNHMQEEKSIASNYFKMSSFKKQATALFLVEELLVVGMLGGLIYLFVQ